MHILIVIPYVKSIYKLTAMQQTSNFSFFKKRVVFIFNNKEKGLDRIIKTFYGNHIFQTAGTYDIRLICYTIVI